MQFGQFHVQVVSGGRFKLDGGAMFGIVPRPLWSRLVTADELGRIPLDTNCLLIRTGTETVLVDSGNGNRLPGREAGFFELEPGDVLARSLADAGVSPEEVTAVVFTHLHMDHCGGASIEELGEPRVRFPRARLFVQRREWEDACANRSHMRTSYRPENLAPLEQSGRLELLDGDTELFPGFFVRVTGGHTPAHQAVLLEDQGEGLLYPADICPTQHHLRPPYNMAYDMEPYATMLAKARLLGEAARRGWNVAFDHEPVLRLAHLREEEGRLVAAPAG